MLNELGVTKGDVLRYTLLPQIFPRAFKLVGSGFINLPYFMAVVFNTLKIIPDNHPYLWRENHGRYSTFQAIAAGANYIKFDRNNIDKLTIFGLILSGLVMLVMQVVLMILALMAAPAYAYNGPGLGPRTMDAFFQNPDAKEDIAFRLLDMVFGIPGIFDSSSVGTTHFHTGFHALLQFYSFGMLLIGTFIIIYLVTAIVLETAESGVPFGKRFNKAWAPVRLILFFGLLLPTANGINLAQYLLLNAAKLGSNVATNAWITFDNATKAPYIGTAAELVATPNTPTLQSLVTFMSLARTCAWAEGGISGRDIKFYAVYGAGSGQSQEISTPPPFSTLITKAKGGSISFRFGVQDSTLYAEEPGDVFPYCGELNMTIVDQAQPGAAYMQQAYVEVISCLWNKSGNGSAFKCPDHKLEDQGRDFRARFSGLYPNNAFPDITPYIGPDAKKSLLVGMNTAFEESIKQAVDKQAKDGKWNNDVGLNLGWAGAGIWFNKIAEQNGALAAAVNAAPDIRKMPNAMEFIKDQRMKQDSKTPLEQAYMPVMTSGESVTFETPQDYDIAHVLGQQFKYWGSEYSMGFLKDVAETKDQDTTGNVFIDTINVMLGTKGLFDICRNTQVNPLAQMASLGKSLVDHSVRSFGIAAGVGISGGILAVMNKQTFAESLQAASSFFMTFAGIGLTLGFVLYYVLPMMPFIYFFFAVMTWVKSIFEAMVGMPLWALAHLRIDGQGMPGDSATAGYFYILEIFIRPICILIGFMASVIIFSSMVKVLNQIFYLVISNLAGHETKVGSTSGCFSPPGSTTALTEEYYKRGPVDEFFFSVVYTIIVYMIGLSCFKLVDLIPDRITRWMGAGIQSFGAMDGDPARNMLTYIAQGTNLTKNQLREGAKGFGFFN